MPDLWISGVPFLALGHHDGRFIRAPGLFAFARASGLIRPAVLHLELSAAINVDAVSGHPRWSWALGCGMDTLFVHLLGRPAKQPDLTSPPLDTVDWHPAATVRLGDLEDIDAPSRSPGLTAGG